MKNSKISVIVPAYNVGPWLSRCLKSILNQSYQNLEIIVIDDGSTDNTSDIVDSFANEDRRVVPIHQGNAGLVAVREKGIELASGDYVGFVDGDDCIEPDFYERLINNAWKYDADISHCGISYRFYNGLVINHYGTGKCIFLDNQKGLTMLLRGEIEPSLCNKLYRRQLLVDSCLDPSIVNNEDLLRNYILFKRAKSSVYEDFCGYQYWRRDDSMSNNDNAALISENVLQARRLILSHSEGDIYPDAVSCYLMSLIAIINGFTQRKNKTLYDQYRKILVRYKKEIHFLPEKNRKIAQLIIVSPTIHKILFRVNQIRKKWMKEYR